MKGKPNGVAPPELVDPMDEPKNDGYHRSFIEWEILEARGAPPDRVWAVDHWLGMGTTTLLAAKGGMGKSIFAQQLATAIAIKHDFVSQIPEKRTVLAWMGEDDDDELWRRQDAICRRFKTSLGALRGRLMFESMIDTDCCLLAKVQGAGLVRTGMLKELREQIGDTKSTVAILDNISMLFGGNENDRGDVTSFSKAIAWATNPTKAAVILIGHVAKGTASEYSGSTAWENAVRSRWWLTDHPPDQEEKPGEENQATDLRYLAKRKVNYTSRDICILKYEDGAYTMVSGIAADGGLITHLRRTSGRKVVLAAIATLQAKSIYGNESGNSSQYLPKVIQTYKLGEGYSRREITDAMHDLIIDGEIIKAEIGKYPNRTPRMGFVIKP